LQRRLKKRDRSAKSVRQRRRSWPTFVWRTRNKRGSEGLRKGMSQDVSLANSVSRIARSSAFFTKKN
jgi:hypothetical protein